MNKLYGPEHLEFDFQEPIYIRDTKSQTEQAGYVDAQTQVTRLIRAGATLRDFRLGLISGEYEYPDGVVPDDAKADPTQDVGFDMADASSILAIQKSKLADMQKEFEKFKVSNKDDEGTEKSGAET